MKIEKKIEMDIDLKQLKEKLQIYFTCIQLLQEILYIYIIVLMIVKSPLQLVPISHVLNPILTILGYTSFTT